MGRDFFELIYLGIAHCFLLDEFRSGRDAADAASDYNMALVALRRVTALARLSFNSVQPVL